MSPALEGGFLITGPPGKSLTEVSVYSFFYRLIMDHILIVSLLCHSASNTFHHSPSLVLPSRATKLLSGQMCELQSLGFGYLLYRRVKFLRKVFLDKQVLLYIGHIYPFLMDSGTSFVNIRYWLNCAIGGHLQRLLKCEGPLHCLFLLCLFSCLAVLCSSVY